MPLSHFLFPRIVHGTQWVCNKCLLDWNESAQKSITPVLPQSPFSLDLWDKNATKEKLTEGLDLPQFCDYKGRISCYKYPLFLVIYIPSFDSMAFQMWRKYVMGWKCETLIQQFIMFIEERYWFPGILMNLGMLPECKVCFLMTRPSLSAQQSHFKPPSALLGTNTGALWGLEKSRRGGNSSSPFISKSDWCFKVWFWVTLHSPWSRCRPFRKTLLYTV